VYVCSDEPSVQDARLLEKLKAAAVDLSDDRRHLFRWASYVEAISGCLTDAAGVDALSRKLEEAKLDAAPSAPGCGYVYDERMRGHFDTDEPHPECPDRITLIDKRVTAAGLAGRCKRIAAREARDEELRVVHTAAHCDSVNDLESCSQRELNTRAMAFNSIYFSPQSALAARLSAGATFDITHAAATGQIKYGFAAVRPPGHHAEADCCMV
jgi:hypothetical protein